MISNPQSLNRLGHFLTPDFKSGGTPSGLAFLFYIRRDAWRACVLVLHPAGRLAETGVYLIIFFPFFFEM